MPDISHTERVALIARINELRLSEQEDFIRFLKDEGIVGIVGHAEGGDDDGYVSSSLLVTETEILPMKRTFNKDGSWVTEEAHEFYARPFTVMDTRRIYAEVSDSGADLSGFIIHTNTESMVKRIASDMFHRARPGYGTGYRSVSDTFVINLKREPVLHISGEQSLRDAADYLITGVKAAVCIR